MSTPRKTSKTTATAPSKTDAVAARERGEALLREACALLGPAAVAAYAKGQAVKLKPFAVGKAPAYRARTDAVRQLIADAKEPYLVVRKNVKGASCIAAWLEQRVAELGLAASSVDIERTPGDGALTYDQIVKVNPLRSRHARHVRALRDLVAYGDPAKTYENDVAREALVACGVARKEASNWIEAANRKDLGHKPDEHALGRHPRIKKTGRGARITQ